MEVMNLEWTVEEIKKVKKKIDEKARTDIDFRTLCLTNPKQAIEQITDKSLPPGFKVRFIENEDAHFTHVLPDPIDASSELSEDELNQVAAGTSSKSTVSNNYCYMCRSYAGFKRKDPAYIQCRSCGELYYKPE